MAHNIFPNFDGPLCWRRFVSVEICWNDVLLSFGYPEEPLKDPVPTHATASSELLVFGPYRLDPGQRLLLSDGIVVPLEPKVFDTLLALVEAQGRLLSKDELLQKVWPGTFVEEGSLARNISTIRKTLGDGSELAVYIETIPKRGYRFIAPVQTISNGFVDAERSPEPPTSELGAALLEMQVVAQKADTPRGIRKLAWLAVPAALVAIAGWGWHAFSHRQNPSSSSPPMERLTSDVGLTMMPALSPDGHLLAYASDRAGRGDLDIWIQQTTGGPPLKVTDDPADDDSPVFSPDGKLIAFRSDRSNPGIYIVPALGGEPRLIAKEGRRPAFSPDGTRLAYWTGQWRGPATQLATGTSVVSLADGQTVRVMAEFSVARDAVWAPDGRSLLVLGKRDLSQATEHTLDWWWVPFDGGKPRATGALDLPGLRKAAASAPNDLVLGAWTSAGAVFSLQGNLWSLGMSLSGEVTGRPQRLTYGPGPYTDPSVSRDGRAAFSVIEPQRVVKRASLADVDAPPLTLYADSRPGFERTTQTADGSTLVLERVASPQGREIWAHNTQTGREHLILRVESANRVSATVSPNGERIAYTLTPIGNSSEGTGFVVETDQGVPRQVCQACALYGFLSDNHRVVASADNGKAIRLFDSGSTQSWDLLRIPPDGVEQVDRPHPSPDDRHLAFRTTVGTRQKSYVVSLSTQSAERRTWREIDEPTTTSRPTGWSADSRVLYLFLDTDGFRCLWGQRVGPSGELLGKPYAVRHFHQTIGMGFTTGFGNAISPDGLMYEISSRMGNIWWMPLPNRGAVP